MEKQKRLTIDLLNQEFNCWIEESGTGRDQRGIRFGQHVHQSYLLVEKPDLPDGFYAESASQAYTELVNLLEV